MASPYKEAPPPKRWAVGPLHGADAGELDEGGPSGVGGGLFDGVDEGIEA